MAFLIAQCALLGPRVHEPFKLLVPNDFESRCQKIKLFMNFGLAHRQHALLLKAICLLNEAADAQAGILNQVASWVPGISLFRSF